MRGRRHDKRTASVCFASCATGLSASSFSLGRSASTSLSSYPFSSSLSPSEPSSFFHRSRYNSPHKSRQARLYSSTTEVAHSAAQPLAPRKETEETDQTLTRLLQNETQSSIMQKLYEVPKPEEFNLQQRDPDFDRLLDMLTLPVQSVDPTQALLKQEDDYDKYFATRVKTKDNFRKLINIQRTKRKYESAVDTWDKLKRRFTALDPQTYVSMMKVYADWKRPFEAMNLFKEMKEKRVTQDIEAYGCIINAFTQARNMERALSLFKEMKKSGLAPNIVVYTDLVHGYWNIRDIDKMWETYEQMRIYDAIQPDQVMYTLLMRACAERRETERAFSLFGELQDMGMQPTEVTYNTLIYACAKRADYYKEAFVTLEKMKAAGFIPDVTTWNSILYASALVGDYEMAERTFQEMLNTRAFDGADEASQAISFVTLFKAYARAVSRETAAAGEAIIKRAYDHVKLLKEMGVKEDLRVLNAVLQIYSSSKRIANTLEFFFSAYNVKRYTGPPEGALEAAGVNAEGGDTYGVSKSPIVPWEHKVHSMSDSRLNLLLLDNGLSTSGSRRDLEERATSKVKPVRGTLIEGREMSRLILAGKEPTVVPDIASYNLLIRLFAETHRSDKALEVWRQIKEHNEAIKYEGGEDKLVPTMHTYEGMVKSLAKGSYLNTSMKFLREMRAKGWIPADNIVKLLRSQLKPYPDLLAELNRLVVIPPAHSKPDYQGRLAEQVKTLKHPLKGKARANWEFMTRI